MPKLGVITDGISREFEHAIEVMSEFGLDQAELQFLWDKEVGDLDDAQLGKAQNLLSQYKMEVPCISRHIFGGVGVGDTEVGDPVHAKHMDALSRCVDMAKAVGCPIVRTMSFRKEMILFGDHGSEVWNVSNGAWDKLLQLMAPVAQLAEDRDVTIAVETGNNAMVTSAYLGRKFVDELGSQRVKILWDPGNSFYCNEEAYPDGYEALRGGYLGHLHMKDVAVDIPKAYVQQRELGHGQMGPGLEPLAAVMKADGYDGAISLESVYRPDGGTFEDGFRASVGRFKELFG